MAQTDPGLIVPSPFADDAELSCDLSRTFLRYLCCFGKEFAGEFAQTPGQGVSLGDVGRGQRSADRQGHANDSKQP